MTIFQCRCGECHDSSERGPCPETFDVRIANLKFDVPDPGSPFVLTRLERHLIVSALRDSTYRVSRGIVEKLKPSSEENAFQREFCRRMGTDPEFRKMMTDAVKGWR